MHLVHPVLCALYELYQLDVMERGEGEGTMYIVLVGFPRNAGKEDQRPFCLLPSVRTVSETAAGRQSGSRAALLCLTGGG